MTWISEQRSETMEAKIRETRNVRDRARSLAFPVHTFPMTNLNSSSPPFIAPARESHTRNLSLPLSFILFRSLLVSIYLFGSVAQSESEAARAKLD